MTKALEDSVDYVLCLQDAPPPFTPVAASSEERHAVSSGGEAIEDQESREWKEASVGVHNSTSLRDSPHNLTIPSWLCFPTASTLLQHQSFGGDTVKHGIDVFHKTVI